MALDFGLARAGKEKQVADAIVEESAQRFHGFEDVGILDCSVYLVSWAGMGMTKQHGPQ